MQPTQKSNIGPIVIVVVLILAIIAAIALSSNRDTKMNEDGAMKPEENNPSSMTGTTNSMTGAPQTSNTNGNTAVGNTGTGANLSPSTRYVSPAGFTVYYPSVWVMANSANNGIVFKDAGVNGATIITAQPSGGTSVTSGNIKYEYDSFKKGWVKTVTVMEQGREVATPSVATPIFYTVDGSPVFAGATPKTNIVAFSTNTFLTISLVGSKWGPVIDPLTKTVAVNGKKIDANTLVNLVNTMVTANKNK